MHIVNLLDAVDPLSTGVWNAAVWTSARLNSEHKISSHVWTNLTGDWKAEDYSVSSTQDISRLSRQEIRDKFLSRFSPSDTIIVSHGAWQRPTAVGSDLVQMGFPWIYVPQGMLEPWSMRQRAVRKYLYWRALEARAVRSASVVRAVSSTEEINLKALLPKARVCLVPNGIQRVTEGLKHSDRNTQFLFLGRLHVKKGVAQLVEGFCKLPQSIDPGVELVVAGPDQGELPKIQELKRKFPQANVRYVGPVYGQAKRELLENSKFFVLPSHSEGFPTSVVEAMGAGCVPIISDGCNFPEAMHNRLCIGIGTDVESIRNGLQSALQMSVSEQSRLSDAVRFFIDDHYTAERIAKVQAELFHELIGTRSGETQRRAA